MSLEAVVPARRRHVGDEVFEQLAAAILGGELAPGEALPPERVLVERFGVSRIIVRGAVHRLADLGLVAVKQGGATLIRDPHQATDLRVLALFYGQTGGKPRGARDVADMIEKQYLQGLSLVEMASRRASPSAREALVRLCDEVSDDVDLPAFEERFWRAVAAAGGSRIFRMEVAWWYETLPQRPVPAVVREASREVRLGFYREVARRLLVGQGATEYYLTAARAILDTVLPPVALPVREHAALPGKRRGAR